MLPTVMARPRMTVPAITMAPPPAERTATPARTPASVSVMASSAPSRRPASEARGAASEKHSTGIPVSRPSSTGEKPSSCCIGPSTGATATKGPRMLRAMSPMHASRIQLRGTFVPIVPLIGRGGQGAGAGKGFSSLPLLSRGGPNDGKAAGPQGPKCPFGLACRAPGVRSGSPAGPQVSVRAWRGSQGACRNQSRGALLTPGASRNLPGCATQPTPLAITCWICGWWYTGYSWSPGLK
jgi:hypothetical protein